MLKRSSKQQEKKKGIVSLLYALIQIINLEVITVVIKFLLLF